MSLPLPADDPYLQELLSPREWEVVRLLAQCCRRREIAETLYVSVKTVEAHMRQAQEKLGLKDTLHLRGWAVKHFG